MFQEMMIAKEKIFNLVGNSYMNDMRIMMDKPQKLRKMAKSSVQSTTSKSRFLKCLFCTHHFSLGERKPWFLKCCLNTVCSRCAQKLYITESGHVECPICRRKVPAEDSFRGSDNSVIQTSRDTTACPDDVSVDGFSIDSHVNGTENGINYQNGLKTENEKQKQQVNGLTSVSDSSSVSSRSKTNRIRDDSVSVNSESDFTDDLTVADAEDVELLLNVTYDNESVFSDTCSTMTSLSVSLPLDPIRVKAIEFNKVQNDNLLPCQVCNLSRTSSWRCENCCMFLCDDCQVKHKFDVKTKRHALVPFDVLKSRPLKLFNHNHFCQVHPFSRLTLFCCSCNVVICSTCTRNAHERKTHSVTTVQEAFGKRVKVTSQLLADAQAKIKTISQRSNRLKQKTECSMVSINCAEKLITSTFDAISEAINQRKNELITELFRSQTPESFEDTEKIGSQLSLLHTAHDYTNELRSKADCVEFLQQYPSVSETLRNLIELESEEVEYSRKGVMYEDTYFDLVLKLIKNIGNLKSVTFKPIENANKDEVTIKPFHTTEVTSLESSFVLSGDIFPQESNSCELKCLPNNRMIILQTSNTVVSINCPTLNFDQGTMFAERSILGDDIMTNHPPEEPLPETGCRLKAYPGALADRTLCGYAVINSNWPVLPKGKYMWVTKTMMSLKQKIPDNKMVFEAALTDRPVDARFSQRIGSSVVLAGCDQHQSLCLKVKYNGKVMAHIPSGKNRPSEKGHYDIGFLLDLDNTTLHIFNMLSGQCIFSIHDIDVTRPLRPVFCVGRYTFADIKLRLVTGNKVALPEGVSAILRSIYDDDRCSTLTFTVDESAGVK